MCVRRRRGFERSKAGSPSPRALRTKSQKQFEIDERSVAVGYAANFAEAAFGVEGTRAGLGIERVEADGIGGKSAGALGGFGDEAAAKSLALHGGKNGHGGEIEGFFRGSEVGNVDGPRLFGLKAEGGDEGSAFSGDDDDGVAHAEEDALFGGDGGPVAAAEAESEIGGDGVVERGKGGGVGGAGDGEGEIHGLWKY